MSDKSVSASPANSYIVVPGPPEQFGHFLGGLLGKPQIIERVFSGTLRVEPSDITNFHHLVEQRVHEQNQATLVQFSAKIFYDDGSSVEVASLEDFLHYAEVRPLISTGISMTWIYLVKFPQKDAPEREQIDVELEVIDPALDSYERFYALTYPTRLTRRKYGRYDTGYVGFRIAHTARSWGTDIEALLSAHIGNLISSKDCKWIKLARRRSGWTATLSFIATFSLLTTLCYRIMHPLFGRDIHDYNSIKSSDLLSLMSAKIDFLSSHLIGSGSKDPSARIVISAAVFIIALSSVMAIFVGAHVETNEPSFILLSKKSRTRMQDSLRAYTHTWRKVAIVSASSVFLGVLANIVFALTWPPAWVQ